MSSSESSDDDYDPAEPQEDVSEPPEDASEPPEDASECDMPDCDLEDDTNDVFYEEYVDENVYEYEYVPDDGWSYIEPFSDERPTVKPISPYDPSGDAQILRKAMKGLGTDESAIIGVLANRTSQQRQEIMMKFQQSYGRDLIKDLKSELSGKFEQVIIALMTPLPIYLARELHHAIAGIGTTESTLIEILCTNSNAWLMAIKQAYHQEFKRTVEDDIKGDTSGDLRRILISMCAACRDESSCDTALANSLAQQLYKAGEGRLGTNEGEFNRILATYSYPLLRCVFEEYKKINGRDFGQAVDSEFSGDIKHGFKAIYMAIQNRSAFFAKEIHDSMAGMGTSDRALIRLVVSRSEIDMVNIKEEYQRMYGKPMEKDIKGDTSGDYKRVLLALCEE